MSLGTNCNGFFLLTGVLPVLFHNLSYKLLLQREDCLMACCSSTKVIKSDSKLFLAIAGLHEDKLCDTSQGMNDIKPPSSIRRGFLPDIIIYYTVYSTVDPSMLLPSGNNPIIYHEEFCPYILCSDLTKRFDNFLP